MGDLNTQESADLLSLAEPESTDHVPPTAPVRRNKTTQPSPMGHVKIDMKDLLQYGRLARHHVLQYFDKRAGWAPLLYALLALSAILLVARESQVIRQSTRNASFFYNVHDLQQAHRASCESKRSRRAMNENATLFARPPVPLCESISQGSLTASLLWKAHQDQLLQASKHPHDRAGRHQGWQKALLELVGPNLLAQALRNPPALADIRRIVQIIDTRRQAMHRKFALKDKQFDMSHAPMLQVVVFGGSVPEGTGCSDLPEAIKDYLPKYVKGSLVDNQIQGKDCTWPYRLQLLADAFLGKWVVSIHNLAIGGTNSRLTIPTLEYQLYQEQALIDAGGADVIINGYAINDNLKDDSSWPANTTSNNQHFDANLDKAQEFVTKALESRPCSGDRPVVLFFDDAYGNHNADIILGDDIRADVIRLVTDMYNLMHISAVAPVKQWVMANEKEAIFSPNWWSAKGNKRITNGHYKMPGHQYAAYTIGYSMLQSLVDYCVAEEFGNDGGATKTSAFYPGQALMERLPYPPTVKLDSKLSTFSDKWNDKADTTLQHEKEYCESANAKAKPCSFAFISNPAGTVRNAKEINSYVDRFIKNKRADNTGWTGMNDMKNGWQNKLGLVATQPGASVLLTISDIQNPIQKLIVQYLKSYGEKWSGSQAEFDLRVFESANTSEDPLFRKTFVLAGEWNDKYSISFQEIVDFRENAATIGQTVTLRITLTGGTDFKIMGLMLCSR